MASSLKATTHHATYITRCKIQCVRCEKNGKKRILVGKRAAGKTIEGKRGEFNGTLRGEA